MLYVIFAGIAWAVLIFGVVKVLGRLSHKQMPSPTEREEP